jgi:hypothetical protein
MSRKRHHYQLGAHYSASAQYRTFLWEDMLDISIPLVPDSMQIGHTLHRLLQNIAYANPAFGPPLLCKFDLSDGYYRVRLTPEAALELAVVIPGFSPNHNLIALPLCLPMGWGQSPPYFCAFTETIADLADAALHSTHDFSEHPLELISQAHAVPVNPFEPTILRPPTAPLHRPLSLVDVYVDDFIGLAQHPFATHTLRALLHSIDKVFRGHPVPDDKPCRKTTISSSKLATGNGAWSTRKTILGWDIDTAAGAIGLPDHKADRLRHILQHFATLRRTSRKKWQSLLGELRHMAMVIPGAKYLFSILQHVLVDQTPVSTPPPILTSPALPSRLDPPCQRAPKIPHADCVISPTCPRLHWCCRRLWHRHWRLLAFHFGRASSPPLSLPCSLPIAHSQPTSVMH